MYLNLMYLKICQQDVAFTSHKFHRYYTRELQIWFLKALENKFLDKFIGHVQIVSFVSFIALVSFMSFITLWTNGLFYPNVGSKALQPCILKSTTISLNILDSGILIQQWEIYWIFKKSLFVGKEVNLSQLWV